MERSESARNVWWRQYWSIIFGSKIFKDSIKNNIEWSIRLVKAKHYFN